MTKSDLTEQLLASNQTRLADLGFYHLRVDGIDGPGTQDAFTRFKEANGFRSRPYPGPKTLARLWSPGAKRAPEPVSSGGDPKWLTKARSLLGTREVPGKGNNPIIMSWAKDLDQWYPGDDVPWCGLFVAMCLSYGFPNEPQDFNRLGARNWMDYGIACGDEYLGAVAVFWRTHPTKSWNGHVGILTGVSDDAVRIIGGNQSDNVTETWISRDRLLGLRFPRDPKLKTVLAPTARTGQLSTNES